MGLAVLDVTLPPPFLGLSTGIFRGMASVYFHTARGDSAHHRESKAVWWDVGPDCLRGARDRDESDGTVTVELG